MGVCYFIEQLRESERQMNASLVVGFKGGEVDRTVY